MKHSWKKSKRARISPLERNREGEERSGLIPVDKPLGMTSHQVVEHIREIFKGMRIGHAGTLDPLATGVLLILVGRGTKLSQYLIEEDKEYIGKMIMGRETDTGDAEGRVVREIEDFSVSRGQIEDLLHSQIGRQLQTPPMYSAVKVDGVPLYQRARRGQVVERKAREIWIHQLRLLDFHFPEVVFSIHCSKGTFIRELVAEWGRRLGCGAYLAQLRRTRCGSYHLQETWNLNDIQSMAGQRRGDQVIIPLSEVESRISATLASREKRTGKRGYTVQ